MQTKNKFEIPNSGVATPIFTCWVNVLDDNFEHVLFVSFIRGKRCSWIIYVLLNRCYGNSTIFPENHS